jgi:hypothetical protein
MSGDQFQRHFPSYAVANDDCWQAQSRAKPLNVTCKLGECIFALWRITLPMPTHVNRQHFDGLQRRPDPVRLTVACHFPATRGTCVIPSA